MMQSGVFAGMEGMPVCVVDVTFRLFCHYRCLPCLASSFSEGEGGKSQAEVSTHHVHPKAKGGKAGKAAFTAGLITEPETSQSQFSLPSSPLPTGASASPCVVK